MYKSAYVHYKNKYPGGTVKVTDHHLDVYDANGEHRVAMRKNGHGQWVCMSEELGLKDRHDLSPIPRDARVHKLYADGSVGLDEECADREQAACEYDDGTGRIQSMDECKQKSKGKYQFDDKGRTVSRPAKQVQSKPAPAQAPADPASGPVNL